MKGGKSVGYINVNDVIWKRCLRTIIWYPPPALPGSRIRHCHSGLHKKTFFFTWSKIRTQKERTKARKQKGKLIVETDLIFTVRNRGTIPCVEFSVGFNISQSFQYKFKMAWSSWEMLISYRVWDLVTNKQESHSTRGDTPKEKMHKMMATASVSKFQ